MKKSMILAIIFSMMLAGSAALAQEGQNTLVVGNTTQMSGNFFLEAWGNNSADLDVRELLHSYPTVVWSMDGRLSVNTTVVRSLTAQRDPDGNRVFEVRLNQNLLYNDGSPVKAADFVFGILLESSPIIQQIGGTVAAKEHILGAAEYTRGEAQTMSGLHLIDDYTFSISVGKEFFPYFYEQAYAFSQPYPISEIAPGASVRDDGEGAYIAGPFSADLLRQTILDPLTGYMSHPQVSSGPYQLVNYDREKKIAEFTINPNYAGNRDGQKAAIERIIYREVKNATMLDELRRGDVNLINKITSGRIIDELPQLEGNGTANYKDYPRSGLAFLAFAGEQGLTQSAVLRGVIARAVDRETLAANFLKGHGEPVYGLYGLGQWMTVAQKTRLKGELDKYPHELEPALASLTEEGWILNAQGQPFVDGTDTLRYKLVDGVLTPLSLRLAVPLDNEAAEFVVATLEGDFAKLGMQLTTDRLELRDIVSRYFRQMERGYDMFFLGSNFSGLFDPYLMYHTADVFQGAFNTSGIRDEKLLTLAMDMRKTVSGSREEYLARWMDFQRYWVEVLPLVPLYSNTYFDAFSPRLTGYNPDRYPDWASAILYANWN